MKTQLVFVAAIVSVMIGIPGPEPASARPQPEAAPDQTAMIPLSDTPYDAPALGLSIYLPEDSVVTSQAVTVGTGRLTVQPRDTEWLLQIYNQRSTNKSLTLEEVLDSIIEQRQKAEANAPNAFRIVDPKTQKPVVVTSQPFERSDHISINNTPAARVYMGFRHLNSKKGVQPVTGYTVFHTAPGEFVIAQLDTPDEAFDRTRRTYETILATASFTDMSSIQAERAAAVLTGIQLLDSISNDDIDAVLKDLSPVFVRLYEPSATGRAEDDTEVAWQRVEIRKGQLGELNPRKRAVNFTPTEREYGYVALITAAFVSPDGSTVQMDARYFLSLDRNAETWFIQNVIRTAEGVDGRPPETTTVEQTVVREGTRLTASVLAPGGDPSVTEFNLPDEGYISKVELLLLSRLVAARDLSGVFGFYTYDSRLDQVVLRRDIFKKTELGTWSARSRDTENARDAVTDYDTSGQLIRQRLPEGRIAEPIDPARLLRIWQDKGLTR